MPATRSCWSLRALPRDEPLLDVGCGAGFFLEEARDQGWQVHGNEYSAHAIEVNRAKGLDVIHGPIRSKPSSPADLT